MIALCEEQSMICLKAKWIKPNFTKIKKTVMLFHNKDDSYKLLIISLLHSHNYNKTTKTLTANQNPPDYQKRAFMDACFHLRLKKLKG